MSRTTLRNFGFYALVVSTASFLLPVGAIAANPPATAILEGGECKTLDEVAPISGTFIKVTCVEKDGNLFWSTNPSFYKKIIEATPKFPCDAECEADRQGNAASDAEALDPNKYFPKWVRDGQNAYTNLVLAKVKLAYGSGEYTFNFPMPQPTDSMLASTSVNTFGTYKLSLKVWSDNEIASLSPGNFEKSSAQDSNKKASGSEGNKVKLEVTKDSDGKFLVAVYSGAGGKSLVINGSKKSNKDVILKLNTDQLGHGSLLTGQKLSGYKLILGKNSKTAAIITVK